MSDGTSSEKAPTAWELQVFLIVAETRLYTDAANALDGPRQVTRQAVYKIIDRIGRWAGADLFTRPIPRGRLELTEAGRRLVPHAKAIVDLYEQMKAPASRRAAWAVTVQCTGVVSALNSQHAEELFLDRIHMDVPAMKRAGIAVTVQRRQAR